MKNEGMTVKLALAVILAAAVTDIAHAQASGAQIRNGEVYFRSAAGERRLTHDGHNTEATTSRDGKLIAYVHQGPPLELGTRNDLYLCGITEKSCVLAVAGRSDDKTDANLSSIQNVRFSLQAASRPDGTLAGSLFFLSDAGGANTLSLHRVPFEGKALVQLLNAPAPFVTYANAVEIVPAGKFAGALQIEQQTYTTQGACGQKMIFDPNTRKILQKIGDLDC